MKDETKYLIEEMKQKQRLDEIYKSRIIEFEDYFKNSGKEELKVTKFKADGENYTAFVDNDVVISLTVPTIKLRNAGYKKPIVYNNMSEYKLKKDK